MRLALVDDHKLLLDGIADIAAKAFSDAEIQVFNTGELFLEYYSTFPTRYDLVITDISMPTMSGVELCERIFSINTSQQVLVLSMLKDTHLVEQLKQMGVRGFVAKDADPDAFIQAIRKTANGKRYFAQKNGEHSAQMRLSKREMEVLRHLAKGQISRDIANSLNLSIHTVDTHRKNMLAKLELHTTVELIRWARPQQLG